jgi:hypothetical protein
MLTIYTKAIVINMIYNFLVELFLSEVIWVLNIHVTSSCVEIQNLEFSNDFGHWYDQSFENFNFWI